MHFHFLQAEGQMVKKVTYSSSYFVDPSHPFIICIYKYVLNWISGGLMMNLLPYLHCDFQT